MRILFATSEATPFAKTGGLADVTSALSKALSQAGHEVTLCLPHYSHFDSKRGSNWHAPEQSDIQLEINVGNRLIKGGVSRTGLPGSSVDVWLIDQDDYFGRPYLYHDGEADYRDNCERFVFFSRAVLEACRIFDFRPDVVHGHDWQTGLIHALLKIEQPLFPYNDPILSVFTIHNLAYQGQFWHWDMMLTGLDWKYFNWRQMEFFGHLNLLKTGLVFADQITTVSPTYAREIQTAEYGCGLQGVLRMRSNDLTGILNGIDGTEWSPQTDPFLPVNYGLENVAQGKAICKRVLQERLGLPVRPEIPLMGIISRLVEQKGWDLIESRVESLLARGCQLAIIGSGDPRYVHWIESLENRHPEQVAAFIGFDEPLAHLVEAGIDIFLMPSRFEPCGLNQMYSLAYGTVPVVHSVGGLADTVVDLDAHSLANGTANGFAFFDYNSAAFEGAVQRALDHFGTPVWSMLQSTGMERDWSWSRSAQEYIRVYQHGLSRLRTPALCN